MDTRSRKYLKCKSLINCPSKSYSCVSPFVRNVKMLTQCFKTCRDSTERDCHVGFSIPALFFLCNPSTIIRLISFIIIYSVKQCSAWTNTHVIQKILKFHPSIANCDPSASIVFETIPFWIRTSLYHACPRTICWASWSRMTMFRHCYCEFPPMGHSSVRHNVGSINVVLSGGCPATTGTRCDYSLTQDLENVNGL